MKGISRSAQKSRSSSGRTQRLMSSFVRWLARTLNYPCFLLNSDVPDDPPPLDPKHKWGLTVNDRAFLRAIRIRVDEPSNVIPSQSNPRRQGDGDPGEDDDGA